MKAHGRADIVGLIVAFLGLEGDVRSEAWLWVARGAVVVIAAEVVVIRTTRHGEAGAAPG